MLLWVSPSFIQAKERIINMSMTTDDKLMVSWCKDLFDKQAKQTIKDCPDEVLTEAYTLLQRFDHCDGNDFLAWLDKVQASIDDFISLGMVSARGIQEVLRIAFILFDSGLY